MSSRANLGVSTHSAFKTKAGALGKELPSSHAQPAHSAGTQSKFYLFLCQSSMFFFFFLANIVRHSISSRCQIFSPSLESGKWGLLNS